MKADPQEFSVIIPVRVTPEQRDLIDQTVNRDRMFFDNTSHFVRSAINLLLRVYEAQKRLEAEVVADERKAVRLRKQWAVEVATEEGRTNEVEVKTE